MAKFKTRLALILLFGQLLLHTGVMAAQSDTVETNDEQLATSERKIKERPVIIHTQQQQYDQPTLEEYQLCHANLDACMNVCATDKKRTACEAECPICPLLFNHDIVVQGINDTDYQQSAPTIPLNTTNIIKLTNEIHNVVQNNMGNVSAHNVNNIQVHNNVSTTGGLFGLGFNKHGSCCLVVRLKKHCRNRRFATAARCHQKRLRVCGERCKARVMYAQRVRYCSTVDGGDCHTRIKYVSHTPPITPTQHQRRQPRCHYQPIWPFVACNRHGDDCQRCLQLSYGYILQHGLPDRCLSCYRSYGSSVYDWDQPYERDAGFIGVDGDDNVYEMVDDDDVVAGSGGGDADDDWRVTKKKCRGPDGIIVDCNDVTLPQQKPVTIVEDDLGTVHELETNDENNEVTYDDAYDDTYDDLDEGNTERHRRHSLRNRLGFQYSKYSKRHN